MCSVGGNVGLMGEIAHTVYSGLGEDSVIGVIPEALQPREVRQNTQKMEFVVCTGLNISQYFDWVSHTWCFCHAAALAIHAIYKERLTLSMSVCRTRYQVKP